MAKVNARQVAGTYFEVGFGTDSAQAQLAPPAKQTERKAQELRRRTTPEMEIGNDSQHRTITETSCFGLQIKKKAKPLCAAAAFLLQLRMLIPLQLCRLARA